ncbi:hypothetical protein FKP32DRAFT_1604925 [Trametes sanguinea]|nr:hypothetical protein FKP32DRAFT_1604925 [Trametes sanguinea]
MAARDFTELFASLHLEDDELDDPDLDESDNLELDGDQSRSCHEQPLSFEEHEPEQLAEDHETQASGSSRQAESPYRNRTKGYRDFHDSRGSLATCVVAVLKYMQELRLDLPLLLWAVSYNVPELITDPTAKFERTALLSSKELSPLLQAWYRPPRGHNRGIKTKGASAALEDFALQQVLGKVQREMALVGTYMRTKPTDLSSEALLSIKLTEMQADVQRRAPTVWKIIRHCSWTSRQEKENGQKNPDATVLFTISMASFMRSNRNNALQRLIAIYLKSCGTSAKAFDTLSALGLTMSQSWTLKAIERLSVSERECLWKDIAVYPWFGSHDNVNFRFRVFEQRSDHHSHFDSGTAGTIFVVKDPDAVAPSAEALRTHRLESLGSPDGSVTISPAEILQLEAAAAPRLATRSLDIILQVLLATPGFDLPTYEHKDNPLLHPAPRPGSLRIGSESLVQQYVLDTVHLEEASYDGNSKVLDEWLRQLKLNTPEMQKHLGTDLVIPWIGDQLTASRLRGLVQFRCDDSNSFERLDWLVPNFGWFHLMFAFESSLHSQYYGTRTGLGLVHAFDVLDRRGLQTTSTQGTFHHTFEEAIDHTLEAHLRALWCSAGGVESLGDLRSLSPEQLLALATRIHDEHASTLATVRLETTSAGLPKKGLDPLHEQTILFLRDLLDYRTLRDAIKHGDVQTMEDMLPRLLFRFAGGRNPNYVVEVAELLQNLHKDWPDDLKNFIRKYCWLTNTSGHDDSWIPIDRAEEHNVCDVKSSYATMGPFATWDYLGKTSASIPCQRRVKDHVEESINHIYRGKSHTRPKVENDIAQLQRIYQDAQIYTALPSRTKLDSKDRFDDVMKRGAEAVLAGKALKGWVKGRMPTRRVTDEDWESDGGAE